MIKTVLFVLLGLFAISMVQQAQAQNDDRLSKWLVGINGGVNFSKTNPSDTININYSSRNKTGFHLNGIAAYDLHPNVTLNMGLGLQTHGYRVYCDTKATANKIARSIVDINMPIGLSFRQGSGGARFFHEKIGVNLHYSFIGNNDTFKNTPTKTVFRVAESDVKKFYPTLFVGIGMGNNNAKGDRFEFGLTYHYNPGNVLNLQVQGGEFYRKAFPLTYRGGMLQATFTYYFNTGNLKKSEEYFY